MNNNIFNQSKKRIAFYTLGCKLNQIESESIAEHLNPDLFKIVSNKTEADIFIINTCTVTSKSDQKARKIINSVSKKYPQSFLLITGCYAQLNPKELIQNQKNCIIIPQSEKDRLLNLESIFKEQINTKYSPFQFYTEKKLFHTRAFLKIQDGCDNRCSFCRIPFARGNSINLSEKVILERIIRLAEKGFKEIVLTGVNISAYRNNNTNLLKLVKNILYLKLNLRIRLSSLNPSILTDEFIDVLCHKSICPHFHISLQSCSNIILKRMKRFYSVKNLYEVISKLKKARSNAFIGGDVIVGFPGETDSLFKETKNNLENLKFTKIHVFPFSKRPGTEAYNYSSIIPERIKKERAKIIQDLSLKHFLEYLAIWKDKRLNIILETQKNGYWIGLTENYLKVKVYNLPKRLQKQGLLVPVTLKKPGFICKGVYTKIH